MTLEGILFTALTYGLPILGTATAITCHIKNGHSQ